MGRSNALSNSSRNHPASIHQVEHQSHSEAFEPQGDFSLTRLTRQAPRYQNLPTETACTGATLADPIEVKRRLAAIFAADVEGYSRLMGSDEVATLDALTKRREILDGLIATHGGRIANTAGDSVLAEFGSAVDAVRCAMEAQDALAEANSTLP